MYQEYWGLKEKPFQNTPDPRFFYRSAEHEEALMNLFFAVEENMGSAMLTGIFGCGKTVVAQMLLEKLSLDRYRTAYINNPQLDYIDLLRSIVRHLKMADLPSKKTELSADSLLETLGEVLENNQRDGRETIVIIDEAHIIEDEKIFEGLRLLLNFQSQTKFLLTLFLLGQPELKRKIEDNKQFEQRIAVKCQLGAFSEEDTRNYIAHRLQVAGAEGEIFDPGALNAIFRYSGGIPRRINRAGDLSLLTAFGKEIKTVNEEIVESCCR